MEPISIATLVIIIVNILLSYKGLTDSFFLSKYNFETDEILIKKDYTRIISSGFLHVSWVHLLFNMLSLYFFGNILEVFLGIPKLVLLYFASLVGGNLLSLYIHRNHGDYSAIGASGAICGVMFASIALIPNIKIGYIGIPFGIPAWLYGLLFTIYTIFGIKEQKNHIGHEAHLGGGISGLLLIILFYPGLLITSALPIALMLVPATIFLYLIVSRPALLMMDRPLFIEKTPRYMSVDEKYHELKKNKELELNDLLDKISASGIESLSNKEKERLEELSK